MQFLKIKRRSGGTRNEAYFVTSRGKFDKGRTEQYISKKKSYVVTGDADSGKTKILKKIFDNAEHLYKCPVYLFSGIDPISEWLTDQGTNQTEKLKKLIERIEIEKAVVLFDDVHKLAGRKLQVAKQILAASARYWMSCININKIPPTLRRFADDNRVEHLELDSDVAFDGTMGAVILLVIIGVMAGHPELAIMAGIGGLLANGRLGSSNKT